MGAKECAAPRPESIESVDSIAGSDSALSFFPNLPLVVRALENAEIGVWAWDMADDKIIWSRNLEKIHRMPAGSFDGTIAAFQADIHPDDRAVVFFKYYPPPADINSW